MFRRTSKTDFISRFLAFLVQVLEFMGGGDLLNLLIERDVFEEDFTRFYVAEVRPLTREPIMSINSAILFLRLDDSRH